MKYLAIAIVVAVVLVIGVVFRMTKGPGRRPVGLGNLARYRGVAEGVVEAVGEGTVAVSYEAGGARHVLKAPVSAERRMVARNAGSRGYRLQGASDWEHYETTSLGDVEVGGPIGVRYDLDDPSRAVLVPNPHGPRR